MQDYINAVVQIRYRFYSSTFTETSMVGTSDKTDFKNTPWHLFHVKTAFFFLIFVAVRFLTSEIVT